MHLSLDAAVKSVNPLSLVDVPFIDQFGDPLFAYSLRDLKGDGSAVIRVERQVDGTQQDFTAENLKGQLESFAGNNSAKVVTWYDQAGSADLTYKDSNISNAPVIVDNLGNYKGAISFESNVHTLVSGTLSDPLVPYLYYISVQSQVTASTTNRFTFVSPSFLFFDNLKTTDGVTKYTVSHSGTATSLTDLNQSDTFNTGNALHVITGERTTSDNRVSVDGIVEDSVSAASRSFNGFNLGAAFGLETDYFLDEVIWYSGLKDDEIVKNMIINNSD